MGLPPRFMGSMVDRAIDTDTQDPELMMQEVPVDMPMDFSGGAEVIEGDDGSAIVRSMIEQAEAEAEGQELIAFDENLAEYLDDSVLGNLASELVGSYEEDLESRSEWENTYIKGLELLGAKYEADRNEPFEGASSVTHPLVSESVVQFQAQAYKELLPSGGPVQTRIAGIQNQETEAQAARVKHYMNFLVTEEMEEFDPDMDQLLFYLPLSGSTFKKVYFDPILGRPVSKFLPAQDVVVPYTATDLITTPRITHVLKMTDNEIRKQQLGGFYRDIDLPIGGADETDEVESKVNEIQGISKSFSDDVRTLLEMHVELDIEGFEDLDAEGEPSGLKLPYIVTLDKESETVLAIRRNYREEDPLRKAIPYFVHYKFMPGLGFYGFGLTHMIGGLGRAATSILRQLIDAGTLSNLPGGFKARGIRVRNSDEPIQPGEWRDIDAPGGAIRDSIMPLPYKEPSATLAQLLGALVEGGRRFVSVADQQAANMGQEAPVGTTVALLERGMKVMSAIHKRLHYAQRKEFRILSRIVFENIPAYPYQPVGNVPPEILQQDFDGRIDILPVSDPNIFSMAQRVALAQEQLKLAQSNPQMHNLHEAYKRMYQALEVQNIEEILPPPQEPQPMDPAMENGRAVVGTPMQAFPQQNHEAHLKAHITFFKSAFVQTNPVPMTALMAHIQEHVAFLAREQAMSGINDQVQQLRMAVQTGAVSAQEAQQQIAAVQQAMQNPEEMNAYVALLQAQILEQLIPDLNPPQPDPMADPLVQIRQAEVQTKQQENMMDAQIDSQKLALDAKKLEQKAASEAARIELQEEIAQERNAVNRERIMMQARMAAERGQGGQ
ncbi:MAG TPA: hypothetical protein VIG24_09570 [Acidimicrobiia bacterium]